MAHRIDVKDFEEENNSAKENFKKSSKKKQHEWRVGEHCRAVYSGDNLLYEAKIITIDGDSCTIEFLGRHGNAEVQLDSLDASLGKKAIRKQMKSAIRHLISDDDENVSGDETRNKHAAVYSPHNRHHSHHGYNDTYMFDQTINYTAAESTFHNPYPVIQHPDMSTTDEESVSGDETWNNHTAVYSPHNRHHSHHGYNDTYMFDQTINYTAAMGPPAVPPCSEVVQSPSLNAMLTAWYMAGYYTGLHQDESVSGDETRNHTPVYSPHNRHHSHHGYNDTYMFDQSNNYTAAMGPPAVPLCSEVVQNPSLSAMLTAWYMAGYYTGLHQAQKSASDQHCHFRHS